MMSAPPSGPPSNNPTGYRRSSHVVQFYETDEFLTETVASYIADGLNSGEAAVCLASGAHLAAIWESLETQGIDLSGAERVGRYVPRDAAQTLATFLIDGMPDAGRFKRIVGGLIQRAKTKGSGVRGFGEMVALLAAGGNVAAVVRLEELWNELRASEDFSLLCAFPLDVFHDHTNRDALAAVCDRHDSVIPSESFTRLSSADDRSRAIVEWQHKAHALEQALARERAARQEAEDALRIRQEFLSIASHELRTPLTSLSGHVQILLRRYANDTPPEPGQIVKSLETIRRQSGKLSRLISQLLDISRLDAGKLGLERATADIGVLVEQVVGAMRPLLRDRQVVVDAAPGMNASVDPYRFEQVLANLLDNAVRYTDAGSDIEVNVGRPSRGAIELRVRDRGPGIPVSGRDTLFERFYQVHPNYGQHGLGLGLHISRQIVELHGGTIHAEFPPDGGTEFVVCLPVGSPSLTPHP